MPQTNKVEKKVPCVTLSCYCSVLPKIELHAHLNGSLNTETLKKLGCNDSSISEYQKLSDIMNKTNRSLEECFALFDVAHNATKTAENVYIAAKSVIEDFYKDNTIYLELRTTPRNEEEMSMEEYVEAVIRAIKECKSTCKTLVNLILSINRRLERSAANDTLDVIIKMREKYPDIIKGIDLSGNPAVGTFDEELFEKARKSGLKTAIHCAEVKNDEEVVKILNFGPDRLGHAIFLHPLYGGSQENWELYCQKKIPVECCLTSNVISDSVEGYPGHHIQEWINLQLPFSINTDDKGIFATTLSKEYEHVSKHFKVTPSELFNITYEAVGHSFASEEDKKRLQYQLAKWYFLSQSKFTVESNVEENEPGDIDDRLYDELNSLQMD